VAVVGWQLVHWIGCVVASILSGRNAKIGALLSEIRVLLQKNLEKKKECIDMDKSDGSGTTNGSGWVAVRALDWLCHCEHFEWSECKNQSIIEQVMRI
jgi:hypothetical protein